jgi:hypothetical protein
VLGSLAEHPRVVVLLGLAVLLTNAAGAVVRMVRALAPQESKDRRAVWFALKDAYVALLSHRRWVRRHRTHTASHRRPIRSLTSGAMRAAAPPGRREPPDRADHDRF